MVYNILPELLLLTVMINALLIDDDILYGKIAKIGLAKYQINCKVISSYKNALVYINKTLKSRNNTCGVFFTGEQERHPDQDNIDVVILDYYLDDGTTGLQLCRMIRDISTIPIVMLSSNKSTVNTVNCLDEGADQYAYKRDDMSSLAARIRASIRTRISVNTKSVDQLSPSLTHNTDMRILSIGNSKISLTEKESRLIQILHLRLNSSISTDEINNHVYGVYNTMVTRRLDVLVGRLRKKLSRVTTSYLILNIRNEGYKLAGPDNE